MFGLSIEEAWRMTTPDYGMLLEAHRAYHGSASETAPPGSKLTPSDRRELIALYEYDPASEVKAWRIV